MLTADEDTVRVEHGEVERQTGEQMRLVNLVSIAGLNGSGLHNQSAI
jgi:hypothetical protein